MKKWKSVSTRLSQAFSFDPQIINQPFQPASLSSSGSSLPLFWFDELLHGGLRVPPPEPNSPLLILLTGPAGSGKTTLAMELSYRWSRPSDNGEPSEEFNSLYITSESEESWLKTKAEEYGWHFARRAFTSFEDSPKSQNTQVTLWQTKNFEKFLKPIYRRDSSFSKILRVTLGVLPFRHTHRDAADGIEKIMEEISLEWHSDDFRKEIANRRPDVVILDSINTLVSNQREKAFAKFLDLISNGPRVLIVLLDSEGDTDRDEHWTYIADMVIRLDKKVTLDYLTRTIEIRKARYQSHVEGVHQLKIYHRGLRIDQRNQLEDIKTDRDRRIMLHRAHPFREEGGIFIYPSFHFHLSRIKRKRPTRNLDKTSAPIGLNAILNGGFPTGRSTAFIGDRGGHKSHLGYLCIAKRLLRETKSSALIISLRDDENVARRTINGILHDELSRRDHSIEKFEDEGRVEILYYPPGFITPEEFFHRMFMSICRLKSRSERIYLLFNSVDQLAARFPLCAEERIFIPGIVEILASEEITSFFIGVEEKGQPIEQYGLLAMADLHLRFSHQSLAGSDYLKAVAEARPKYLPDDFILLEDEKVEDDVRPAELYRAIVVQVIRFSGGQAAGPKGILELVDGTDERLLQRYGGRRGLRFSALT